MSGLMHVVLYAIFVLHEPPARPGTTEIVHIYVFDPASTPPPSLSMIYRTPEQDKWGIKAAKTDATRERHSKEFRDSYP